MKFNTNLIVETASERANRFINDRNIRKYLTYDDVSIIPSIFSVLDSRRSADVTEEFVDIHGNSFKVAPIFGASMQFFQERFARDLYNGAGIHILPRVNVTEQQNKDIINNLQDVYIGVSIGKDTSVEFLQFLEKSQHVKFISIDIAHGASYQTAEILEKIISNTKIRSGIIIGNVGSLAGYVFVKCLLSCYGLKDCIIKVGIGPGAACTTRLNAGVGVGQFSLLKELYEFENYDYYPDFVSCKIIADGGINHLGDFAKALAFSNGVMAGKIFVSESMESTNIIENENGTKTALYYGMASEFAKNNTDFVEGGLVKHNFQAGKTATSISRQVVQGIQSAMTYVNSMDLNTFRQNVRFVENSIGAIKESGLR